MSLSKEEINKLYELFHKLDVTYKSSINNKIKSKIEKDLNNLKEILDDINKCKWINPARLKLYSGKSNKNNKIISNILKDSQVIEEDYDLEFKKISVNSDDLEIDTLYSYFYFFDKNFYSFLSPQNLKLRYELGKKRDELLVLYDLLIREVQKYKEDIDNITIITNETKKNIVLERITTERLHIIGVFDDFFRKLLELISTLHSGYLNNEKFILNPEEIFIDKQNMSEMNLFENKTVIEVLIELEKFLKIFLTKIKIPKFLKKDIYD